MTRNKRCALSLRCDDDGELDVASRPKKGEVCTVFMKRLTRSINLSRFQILNRIAFKNAPINLNLKIVFKNGVTN